MAAEVENENEVAQPTPDELVEAEKFKELANENFKSENLTYSIYFIFHKILTWKFLLVSYDFR